MALQHLYSFDHVTTADLLALPRILSADGTFAIDLTSGRDGTGCLRGHSSTLQAGVGIGIDPNVEISFGAWVVIESSPLGSATSQVIMAFCNPAASYINNPDIHTCILARPDGSIQAYRVNPTAVGSNPIANSAPGVISFGVNASFYLEVKVLIASLGSVQVKVNGATVINVANVNTQQGPDANVTFLRLFGPQSVFTRWDDIYINTAQDIGDGWNGLMGIVKVHAKIVNGIGDLNQWTPTTPTGINWQNVDEPTPNQTDYNSALTPGLIDTYAIEDVAFNPSAVQLDLYMKKLDAGASLVSHTLRMSGINYINPVSVALSSESKFYRAGYTVAPTLASWTMALFNSLQVGLRKE